MLAMGLTTHAMKAVTFYNTLETLSLGTANYVYLIAFGENIYGDSVTNIFFFGKISEFFDEFFGRSVCFGEVIDLRLDRVLFIFVSES
jgi:hypothetical protein